MYIYRYYTRTYNIIFTLQCSVVGSQSGLHRVLLCGCGRGAEGLVRAGKGISARDPSATAAALMSSIWFHMVAVFRSLFVQYDIIFSSHILTNDILIFIYIYIIMILYIDHIIYFEVYALCGTFTFTCNSHGDDLPRSSPPGFGDTYYL
jgi:hypothetical protein